MAYRAPSTSLGAALLEAGGEAQVWNRLGEALPRTRPEYARSTCGIQTDRPPKIKGRHILEPRLTAASIGAEQVDAVGVDVTRQELRPAFIHI